MKIRTPESLFDYVYADLVWRKKELSVFAGQVDRAPTDVKRALLRASVAMVYAHWEGFVKNACHWYVCFLVSRRLTTQQARPELVALAYRARFASVAPSKRIELQVDIIRDLRENATSRLRLPTSRVDVRTESNLSYRVLMDLLTSIGCATSDYERFGDLIDDQLVASRNRVAHGEQEFVSEPEWVSLKDTVVHLMDSIANQIIEAAIGRTYLA